MMSQRILRQREAFAYRLGRKFSEEEWQRHVDDVQRKLQDYRDMDIGNGLTGHDSRSMYGTRIANGRTHWNRDRRRQHQDLIRHFYQQMQQVPTEGKGIMMAGLGGAGKGALQRPGKDGSDPPIDTRGYFTIDPDKIKEEMARRGMIPQVEGLSPMEASPLVHEEASDLAKRLALLGYRHRHNLIWDTTMSGEGSALRKLSDMRKAGYNDITGVLADNTTEEALRRAHKRHRSGEESYGEDPRSLGGRPVPSAVSASNEPTPGSGQLSRPAEVFQSVRKQLPSSIVYNMRDPALTPTSVAGNPDPATFRLPPGVSQQQVARRRRFLTERSYMATTRELIEQYEDGKVSFPQLVATLASHEYPEDPSGGDWGEVYARAEEMPGPDDFFWVEAAVDSDVLTPEQVETIIAAIDRYHRKSSV
jgi:hypothetical protein